VGDGDDRALEFGQPGLQRLRRDQVEVVGRFIEQQQCRPAQFEQQDLEASLLATAQGVEVLVGTPLHLVTAQHAHRRSTNHVVVVEDLQQRASRPVRVFVGLVEQAGYDAGAEAHIATVRHGGIATQQA
jgi:hypothetical protein